MYISSKNECIIEETLMKLNAYLFLMKDNKLLEKHNKVWEKVKSSLKKEFDSEPVCNGKYLNVKIKSYKQKINTNIVNNKMPKEGSQSVILIDYVFKTGKKCYPQVF